MAEVVNCVLHLAGFFQWFFPVPWEGKVLAHNPVLQRLSGLSPEKTEGAEVRHGSSSPMVHPQPRGPDAKVLEHQETTRFVQIQELWGRNQTCSWL